MLSLVRIESTDLLGAGFEQDPLVPTESPPPGQLVPPGPGDEFSQFQQENAGLILFHNILRTVSFAAMTYHGTKRNNSIGWGLWWGLMGAVFPIATPVFAFAMKPGFAKEK